MKIMAANSPSPEELPVEPHTLPYYFPDLRSLTEVVELLSYHIEVDGAFILRNSSSGTNYTLTVVHRGGVKHIKIQADRTGYRLAKRSFESLSELITYYGTHDVPNVEAVSSVRLTHPVSRDYINSNETSLPSPTSPTMPAHMPRFPTDRYIGTGEVNDGTIGRQRADSSPPVQREIPNVTPSTTSSTIRAELENLIRPANTILSPRAWANGEDEPSRPRAVRPPPPPPIAPTPTTAPPTPHAPHQSPYDYAANISHNHTDDLIFMLKMTERCECGLYIQEATLPGGWTLHLTENNERKVFFVSPDQKSSWELPEEIRAKLQSKHKTVLRKYEAL